MSPFPKPIAAEWTQPIAGTEKRGDTELVNILAVSEDEYLAVNAQGHTIVDFHVKFRITDYDVRPWEGS